MSEPTTTEMIAWCEYMIGRLASSLASIQERGGHVDQIDDIEEHSRILRAIVNRLQQSAGKSEPPPTFGQ